MRLLQRLARLATITTLLGGTAALVAVTSPAASAAPAAARDGWVRIAHLSPVWEWALTCFPGLPAASEDNSAPPSAPRTRPCM